MSLKVGLIGCGAIGTVLAQAIESGQAGNTRLLIVYDIVAEKAKAFCNKLLIRPRIAENFEEFLACEDLRLVVEAASQEAVKAYGTKVLMAGKDLMIMSVGALVESELAEEMERCALEKGVRIYIPSGAIAGLDGVKAAVVGKVDRITLTTRKPPEGLKDAPYVRLRKMKLGKLKTPKLIYEGPAYEACKFFPANVNVAAALSLAGVGPEKTMVKIIADPSVKHNIHEIFVKGEFGELKVHVDNVPSADNPKTSYLAALSAISLLKRLSDPLVIGA